MPSAALLRISFHGDTIECVRSDDGQAYVVIKRVCENLGIAYQPQIAKLQEAKWATVTMIVTVGNDGKSREMACLNMVAVPKWLSDINPKKIADELLRHKLEIYQAEAAGVLWNHFSGQGNNAALVERLDRLCATLERSRDETLATLRQEMDERFKAQEVAIEARLQEQLPLGLKNAPAGNAFIDHSQQLEIQNLLLRAAERQHVSFNQVHGRFRQEMRVSGYKHLRIIQWPDAMRWLKAETAKDRKNPQQEMFDLVQGMNTETSVPPHPASNKQAN